MIGLTRQYCYGEKVNRRREENPRLNKQLLMNYVACSSLIKTCESYTGYKVFRTSTDSIYLNAIEIGEVILLENGCCIIYKNYEDSPNFVNITQESYTRVKELCMRLIKEYDRCIKVLK